jgi:hypothetical protein
VKKRHLGGLEHQVHVVVLSTDDDDLRRFDPRELFRILGALLGQAISKELS